MNEEKKCCANNHQEELDCCGREVRHNNEASCCGNEKVADSKKETYIKLGVSLVSLLISLFLTETLKNISMFFHYVDFAWIALILCGIPIVRGAIKSLRKGKITTSLLVTTAMVASVVLEILCLTNVITHTSGHTHSYIFAAGEIAFLMTVGGALESYTVSKSRSGIEKLINLTPKMATVEVFGMPVALDATKLKVNDVVVVKPGEMIPIDGEIVFGETSVDESNMTGESIPVDKVVGDKVFGGTINTSGIIKVKALVDASNMQLNKLIKLVEEAEHNKAPIVQLADKWASYVVPSAIVLAILITFITSFFVPFVDALTRGVTILCVFCPCSLALATPTAIAAGLGAGTKHGVLIKKGVALETMSHVNVMAFDKTGTITEGKIKVSKVYIDDNDLLSKVYSLEKYSEHPVAKAIAEYCVNNKINEIEVNNPKALVGVGIEATYNNDLIRVVKYEDINSYSTNSSFETKAVEELKTGHTVVAVIVNDEVKGIISLSDSIKEDAKSAIEEIKELNINTIMLTGDNKYAADSIANEVGVSESYSSLLPDQKLEKINELKNQNNVVCMIGDGVNDAPSLAAANTSIAFAKLGSDVAIEAADISLLNNNIKKLPIIVRLSRTVLKTIRFNIIFGLVVNIASTILSAFGLIDPVSGALIHNCSSVFVVANSSLILARNYDKKKQTV